MAKLCTERIHVAAEKGSSDGSISIKFDIFVNKSGEFTTTLPKEIVDQLEAAQIFLETTNRMGTKGFLTSSTKDGLTKKVSELAKEYVSRELVSEKLVIRYAIETKMSYQLSKEGKVLPNGSFIDGTGWRSGTISTNATNRSPYGLKVYAGIFAKKDWKYKSGIIKTTLDGFWGSNGISQTRKEAPNLHWLANLTTISPKDDWGSREMDVSEMDYTEENAKFFVDLISALCLLNEKILPIIRDRDSLLDFINSKQKLI